MIEELEIRRGSIPLTKTNPPQLWTEEWSNQLFVKITTSGIVGWGEILPAAGNSREPYASLVERLKEMLIGQDEDAVENLWKTMRRMTFTGGYGITTGAISGIDIALWDTQGKKKKLPINLLLNSEESKRKVVQRYASLSRYGTNEGVSNAVKNLVDVGYNSIKIHQHAKDTLDSVKMIRQNVGYDFDLMADLNCGFDKYETAEDFAKNVSRFELKWIEEPLWPPDDFEGLKKLNKLSPVAAGENFFSYYEFKNLLDNDCLTYYQPDVTKCGGITALKSIFELFSKYGAKVTLHNRPHNGWVGTMASAHVAAALGDRSTIIETPPNEIPGGYYDFVAKLDKKSIEVAGEGLGISPKEPIPESKGSKLLQFH